MPKAYSGDLRERVIEAVASGASRREAAERFEVSVSSAVKWLQRWRESRSAAPKPRGGSVSPLEKLRQRDLASHCRTAGSDPGRNGCGTAQAADSKPAAARSRGFSTGTASPSKKACRRRSGASRCGARAPTWIREQGMFDPARLVFIDETAVSTNLVRLKGRALRGERVDRQRSTWRRGRPSPLWPPCATMK